MTNIDYQGYYTVTSSTTATCGSFFESLYQNSYYGRPIEEQEKDRSASLSLIKKMLEKINLGIEFINISYLQDRVETEATSILGMLTRRKQIFYFHTEASNIGNEIILKTIITFNRCTIPETIEIRYNALSKIYGLR